MQQPEGGLLKQISLPESCIKLFKNINRKALENLKNSPTPNFDDGIPLGQLEKEERATMLLFEWSAEINGIIENLNIVIYDLSILHSIPDAEPISRRSRFYFLVRCYFHEFYRFRELFSRAVHALQLWGVYDKPERLSIQTSFHEAFEEMINTRDQLVHGLVNWKGKGHLELALNQAAFDQGFALTDNESGQEIGLSDTIQKLTSGYIEIFHREGTRMTETLQITTDCFWALLVPPNPPLNSDPTCTA